MTESWKNYLCVGLVPRPFRASVCQCRARPGKTHHMQWCTWLLGGRVEEWQIAGKNCKWVRYFC